MKYRLAGALRRFKTEVAAYLLTVTAVAFGLDALYTYVAGMLNATLAAVVTAGGALVLVGLIALGGFICRTIHRPRRRSGGSEAEELGAVVARLMKENAGKATVVALVTGFTLGVSPRLRHSLVHLLRGLQKP